MQGRKDPWDPEQVVRSACAIVVSCGQFTDISIRTHLLFYYLCSHAITMSSVFTTSVF